MPAVRLMPTQESADLIELTRSIADKELRPQVDEAERAHAFPRAVFTTLGRAGLLSLPYPEEYGGGGPQRVADRVQVAGDPHACRGRRGDGRLDLPSRGTEEATDDVDCHLVFGLPERVQGRLGAVQAGGKVVEGEVPEALGEEQRHELVE